MGEVRTLAIDPGNTESAYVIVDDLRRPVAFGKIANSAMLDLIYESDELIDDDYGCDVAIEMVGSFGMAVGADVFETCVWVGRFFEALAHALGGDDEVKLIKRQPVKLHHCHSAKAKDSNIIQALVDRFAPGQPNFGKGTKANPGWFYGFSKDVWQAYALAVYAADTAA